MERAEKECDDVFSTSGSNNSLEDDRVMCSNSHSLDQIMAIVSDNLSKMAEKLQLGDRKTQFVKRLTEVFKNSLEENVTVGGLPWIWQPKGTENKDSKAASERQNHEALLSRLSKNVEKVAHKRRHYPAYIRDCYAKSAEHRADTLKRAKLDPSVLPVTPTFEKGSLQSEKFVEVSKDILSLQKKLEIQKEELARLLKDVEISRDIANRQRPYLQTLYDTGYLSESPTQSTSKEANVN